MGLAKAALRCSGSIVPSFKPVARECATPGPNFLIIIIINLHFRHGQNGYTRYKSTSQDQNCRDAGLKLKASIHEQMVLLKLTRVLSRNLCISWYIARPGWNVFAQRLFVVLLRRIFYQHDLSGGASKEDSDEVALEDAGMLS